MQELILSCRWNQAKISANFYGLCSEQTEFGNFTHMLYPDYASSLSFDTACSPLLHS